jgi:hypothetical protein
LFTQLMERAFARACARAGSSMEARMAMIAITTNSSISVKRLRQRKAAEQLDAGRTQWEGLISTPFRSSVGENGDPIPDTADHTAPSHSPQVT